MLGAKTLLNHASKVFLLKLLLNTYKRDITSLGSGGVGGRRFILQVESITVVKFDVYKYRKLETIEKR